MRRRGGIRLRITAVAVAVVFVVLALAGLALLRTQRIALTDNLDEALIARSDDLAAQLGSAGTDDELLIGIDDDSIAQIVDSNGSILASSTSMVGLAPLSAPPTGAQRRVSSVALMHGEPTFRIASTRSGDVVIHVGAPEDDIDETVAALRRTLLLAIPAVVAVLAAMIWWLVGRTLRPVESIRAEVSEISGSSLDRRVVEPATNDEVSRLARTMNEMLGRIEASSERQRRFVADASHELRSPLTRIRSELEVDLAHPTTADLAATHRSVLDETEHMQRLVEDLLVLARHDAGTDEESGGPSFDVVDLDDIVLREIRRRSSTTSIRIDSRNVSAAQVVGDDLQLQRLTRNLLDNAERHATTEIVVTLGEVGSKAVLTVADDGEGIPQDQHDVVFERFTRLDTARSAQDGGVGLGLSIARLITQRHGGSITIDPNEAIGARFVVELPVAPSE